jgi:pimeloyl-ACP methyl ester carboxylesterase
LPRLGAKITLPAVPNKYFRVEGVATYVLHTGLTTLPHKPPAFGPGETVLCLHGAGGNGNGFREVMERLAPAHGALAFDMPGHGRSGGLDSLGAIDRMAAFTGAFVAKLGLERPVLFGHSMGGAVALQCALDAPDSLRALVLLGSAACFGISEEMLEQRRLVTEGKAPRPFRRELYAPNTPPEVIRTAFMEGMKTDPRASYGDYLALRDFDVQARLGEIAVPTLVLVGADEMSSLAAQADVLAAGIPGARKGVIPDAAHEVQFEQPAALADAIGEFLGALP